ncbi:MAG: SDR family oxidoreductase [Acidimicrobiia bacterium]
MRIRDAHAIVTGGSQGIGLATARVLASRGARVSLIARDEGRLAQAAAAVGPGTHVASADVTDLDAVTNAIDGLVAEQGPCELLVTAAGSSYPGYFELLDVDTFRAQMELNYFGTLHPIRVVLGPMLERGSGTIVGISSAAALVGVFGYGAYAPSKYAVRGLMETLRAEIDSRGVFVACAFPPDTLTPGFETENLTKPPETVAVSAGVSPKMAEEIGAGLVRGIEKDRHVITFDPTSALLARGGGLVAPIAYKLMEREVRKVANP